MILFVVFFGILRLEAQEKVNIGEYETHFSDWTVKVFHGKADYQIKALPKPMITLATSKSNFMLVREFKRLDLLQTPILSFEWMVEKHPAGGDLRVKEKDDQAAGLYVTLPYFPEMINFYSIGYVWDDQAPVGIYPSRWRSRIRYVVLRSGTDGLGQWQHERRNLLHDFKTIWNITIHHKQNVVVSLAANSNNTVTSSLASFGQMSFEKQ